MSLLFWKPPLAKFLFLIYHLVSHISAINHLRDKFDQVELRLDGASFTDTHDNIDLEGVSQHVFREFAAGLSSRTDLVKHDRVSPHHVHEVMFAIQQRNLDILTEMLHDIADPDSSNYGQHKTRAEIEEISSNPESCDAVVRFLEESGATVVSQSHHGEYVTAHAPISLWENLLNTEFFVFHHTHPKNDVIAALVRAEEYSVPKELHEHVASVLQTIQMPLALWGYPVMFGASNVTDDIHNNVVSGFISPETLKYYYHVTDNGKGSIRSTQAVFQTIGAFFSPKDLVNFQTRFNLTIQPVTTFIGGHVNDDVCTFMPQICGEPNLDIQYMMAVNEYSPTTHWYTDKNRFSDWLIDVANAVNPPLVISISYGAGENTVTAGEFDAFNFQAIKLGLMGITILVSSGDDGVLSHSIRAKKNVCGYVPSFPASSPYVTTIGATQGPESLTLERACQSDLGGVITSGGGFSTYYPQPDWQMSDIETYFTNVMGTPKEPASGYKRSGRGYPDLAIAGTAYLISVGGSWFSVSGTSASCPVFAGMISLINGARLAANMSSVGWLNPTLYKRKHEFTNDVLKGKNNCGVGQRLPCCREGFHATPGWDPTTGLGSVNFKLLKETLLGIADLTKVQSDSPSSDLTASPTNRQTSSPSTEAPVTSSPSAKAPITSSPSTKAPVTSSPSAKAPVTSTPSAKAPVTSSPSAKASVTSVPSAKAPVTSFPSAKAPVTSSPSAKASVTSTPSTKAPVTSTPSAKAPVTAAPSKKSVTSTPSAKASVTSTPSAKASVTSSPSAKASVTSTPSAKVSVTSSPSKKTVTAFN